METNNKIKVECKECGKSFTTTQEWFNAYSIEGRLSCGKCRREKFKKVKESEK